LGEALMPKQQIPSPATNGSCAASSPWAKASYP